MAHKRIANKVILTFIFIILQSNIYAQYNSLDPIMKRLIISILFLFIISEANSINDSTKLDSLFLIVNDLDLSDSVRFYSYDEISRIYALSNPRKSLEYSIMGYEISKKMNDTLAQGIALRQIGAMNLRLDKISEALGYHLQALALFKLIGDENKYAEVLQEIGVDYVWLGKYNKALSFMQQAIETFNKTNNELRLSTCLNNLGGIYYYLEQYDSALFYYQESSELSLKIDDKKNLSYAYHNIGEIHLINKNYIEAEEYIKKSLKLKRELGNLTMIPNTLITYGSIEIKLEKYESAFEHFTEAISISKEIGSKNYIRDSYKQLVELEEKKGRYNEALKYHKELLNIEKEIQEDLKNEYVTKLQVEFETAEVENENNLLKEKAKRQKIVRNSLIAGFVLMALLVLVVLRSFLQKRKANIILAEQKEEIKTQSEELKVVNEKLIELDHFKEGLMGMIVHDLKNPLSAIVGATSCMSNNLSRRIIFQSEKKMTNLIMNILDIQKYKDATMKLNKENSIIFEIAENAIKQVEHLFTQQNSIIINKIYPGISIYVDRSIIERIYENLLTNAIKFSSNNESIILGYKIKEDKLILSVSNKGEVIPEEYKNVIFDKFTQVVARDTAYYGSTGLGLRFCKLAVESHGGEIGVISEKENDTTFWFSLPYNKPVKIIEDDFTGKVWKERKVELSEEDKKIILPYIDELKELKVYEASEINEALVKINTENSTLVSEWGRQVLDAVCTNNQEKYNELINL